MGILPVVVADAVRATLVRSVLKQQATIQRVTRAPDGRAGSTRTWSDVPGTIPCFVDLPARDRPGEYQGNDLVVSESDADVMVLDTVTLSVQDRLVVDGITYEVIKVDPPGPDRIVLRCQCARVS